MGKYVMTAKACTIYDDERSEYRTFFKGDTFEDGVDDHLLLKMGEHLFAPVEEPKKEDNDLYKLHVPELVQKCKELGVEPLSGKKQDLIRAIEEATRIHEE